MWVGLDKVAIVYEKEYELSSICQYRSKQFFSLCCFPVLGWVSVPGLRAAFMECCWAGQWSGPTCMAVVLLDLCDRLLKPTDNPALQAAIHQPLDLLQPWEHRHMCLYMCVWVWVSDLRGSVCSRNRACCWMIRPADLVTSNSLWRGHIELHLAKCSLSAGFNTGRSNSWNRNLF